MEIMKKPTKEDVARFLNGSNPMEHIIKIECEYDDDCAHIIYRDEEGRKKYQKDSFYPFCWCKQFAARELYGGDRQKLKDMMNLYGIGCKGLITANSEGISPQRMLDGYRVMFYAKISMNYTKFMEFFEKGGVPIYPKPNDKRYGYKDYICVSPVEQYMIATGKRMFKGYENYDDLLRLEWDLETEGLDPHKDAISQIGIRTNKGFEKIITITGTGNERRINEIKAINEFFMIIKEISPDIITGHNTENFDWNFIDVRLQLGGSSLLDFTKDIFPKGVFKKKKQAVLKLGGEMEYYYPTVMWGTNITDSLHAVRRAQALDSSMKKADLKYVTKYSGLNKPNRVYVPGKFINSTWEDMSPTYAFNDSNGHWFKFTDSLREKTYTDDNGNICKAYAISDDGKTLTDNKKGETFGFVTGRYIVERYLLDDLYETDKVELRYNESNYLVGKMLPTSFEKMCTMGTAAIWKFIMLAWSYEHNLAVPELIQQRQFTGGLSRLLKVGYVDRVVKLDYNSLYPSIILTYAIQTDIDITGVMSALLEYILTQREYYKGLKAEYGAKALEMKKLIKTLTDVDSDEYKDAEEKIREYNIQKTRNDKMQLPLKITGNAFFGSYGSGSVFPWSDILCAEETTCTGRQCLRLMIHHFSHLFYTPIVGDSFTSDTPLFIKYKDSGYIDIKPICDIIDEKSINIDKLGREYDYSEKDYYVLCRSGWVEPTYIYRHKTDKDIYRVTNENGTYVDITKDHSLYNSDKEKINPTEIGKDTVLEYYEDEIKGDKKNAYLLLIGKSYALYKTYGRMLAKGKLDRVPVAVLNSNAKAMKVFYDEFMSHYDENIVYSKTVLAGIKYLSNMISKNKQ